MWTAITQLLFRSDTNNDADAMSAVADPARTVLYNPKWIPIARANGTIIPIAQTINCKSK